MTIGKWVKGKEDILYGVFRILVGLMFFLHGWAKLFGPKAVQLVSLMGLAGVFEFVGGALVLLGLWSRIGALLGAVTMLVAFLYMHLGWNPLATGGELPILYFVSFLVILVHGAGSCCSLEKKLWKSERF